jgi:CBS domain-containing protein
MTRDPVTAPADMSVEDFVETVLARHPHDVIPVTSDGEIVGAAGFKQAREIARSQWRTTSLTAIAVPLSDLVVAEADEPIEIALERLQRARMSRAIVLNRGRLAGMLTLSDLAAHLRFRADLAQATGAR